jgi:hypothetical protein
MEVSAGEHDTNTRGTPFAGGVPLRLWTILIQIHHGSACVSDVGNVVLGASAALSRSLLDGLQPLAKPVFWVEDGSGNFNPRRTAAALAFGATSTLPNAPSLGHFVFRNIV